MVPRVFVCYRREDSAYAAQNIYEALKSHFGAESAVFDVETIAPGRDFREYLDRQVAQCDVLLAVIGDRWLELLGERADDPEDFVRIEIEAALVKRIPVIPVLIGKASMPRRTVLPEQLEDLSYRHATEVRAGPDMSIHLRRLMEGLDDLLSARPMVVTGPGAPTWEEDEKVNRRILIEGLEFLMGNPMGIGSKEEHPPHRVRLSRFYIQEHPVTNDEYRRFAPDHEIQKGKERHPVVNVNWQEAMAYATWLGGSLPTEAQWEYVARGPEGRTYPWGEEEPTLKHAQYEPCNPWETVPVKSCENGKTPEGVYGLAGNVWEWCRDWYGPYAQEKQQDPSGPKEGKCRVLRGGGCSVSAEYLRGASRHKSPPERRNVDYGFRVVWCAGPVDSGAVTGNVQR